MSIDRRSLLAAMAASAVAGCIPLDQSTLGRLAAKLRLIEAGIGGRLGVAMLAGNATQRLAYNEAQRFPLCSTFKTSLAALVLSLEQQGRLDTAERVTWTGVDLVSHRPFIDERGGSGATILELARAAQVVSDNVAANLLLARVGGPEAVTALWRSMGDTASRLDRTEPQLNFVPPGEERDTTTALAMAQTLNTLLFDEESSPLDPARRALLRGWMQETRTGAARVRAALGDVTVSGDKTGNSGDWPGMGFARGDIGFAITGQGVTIPFAVYHQADPAVPLPAERADRAFAEVGRVLRDWITYNTIVVT